MIQIITSQSPRQDSSKWESKTLYQEPRSYDDQQRSYQTLPSMSRSSGYATQPVQRSNSVDSNKEAEVDALTDLLVQNMSVAGNPDFYGNEQLLCPLSLFASWFEILEFLVLNQFTRKLVDCSILCVSALLAFVFFYMGLRRGHHFCCVYICCVYQSDQSIV